MTAEVTVGIDIGTTSVKAVAADGEGNVVASARVSHPLRIPSAESLEQVCLFLGVVKLLRKRIDVMEHRVQQFEMRLDREIAGFTHDVEQGAQHGRKRAVLLRDDAYGLQRTLSGDALVMKVEG